MGYPIREFNVMSAQDQIDRLRERIEAVEKMRWSPEARERLDALADRVAALEERVDRRSSKVMEHKANTALDQLRAQGNRITALESRQQDEAGEGAEPDLDEPLNLQPKNRGVRHCLTDGALESLKEEVRQVTAREIVGGLRRGDANSGSVRADLRSQEICADWIEREFGGGVESEAP